MDITSVQLSRLLDDTSAYCLLPSRVLDAGASQASNFWACNGYVLGRSATEKDTDRVVDAMFSMCVWVLRNLGFNPLRMPLPAGEVISLMNSLNTTYAIERLALSKTCEYQSAGTKASPRFFNCNGITNDPYGIVAANADRAVIRTAPNLFIMVSRAHNALITIPANHSAYGFFTYVSMPRVLTLAGNNVTAAACELGSTVTMGDRVIPPDTLTPFVTGDIITLPNDDGADGTTRAVQLTIVEYNAQIPSRAMRSTDDMLYIYNDGFPAKVKDLRNLLLPTFSDALRDDRRMGPASLVVASLLRTCSQLYYA